MAEGECDSCHEFSGGKAGLMEPDVNDLCLNCHDAIGDAMKAKAGHPAVADEIAARAKHRFDVVE